MCVCVCVHVGVLSAFCVYICRGMGLLFVRVYYASASMACVLTDGCVSVSGSVTWPCARVYHLLLLAISKACRQTENHRSTHTERHRDAGMT